MAVAHRSLTSLGFATRSNSTLSAPAGLANDDILVLILFAQNTSGPIITVTPPTGFAGVSGSTSGLLVDQDPAVSSGDTGQEQQLWAFWKRASGESGSYATSHSSQTTAGYLGAYTGCVTSGDPTDNPSATGNSGMAGGAATATGVTTAVAGSMIIAPYGCWDNFTTTSPPTGMIERLELIAFYVADEVIAAAGATGTRAITSGPASNGWVAGLIALEADAGGGRTTRNTRAWPLGTEVGMNWRLPC